MVGGLPLGGTQIGYIYMYMGRPPFIVMICQDRWRLSCIIYTTRWWLWWLWCGQWEWDTTRVIFRGPRNHQLLAFANVVILLMVEILHHLGCITPCKWWDIYNTNWCRISSINRITVVLQEKMSKQCWRSWQSKCHSDLAICTIE